jgi:hypothetical protein
MPYCHKCGTKLDEDAKFCYKCGTAVGVPETTTPTRHVRTPMYVPAIALAAVLVVGMFAALAFLPIHSISFTQAEDAPFEAGITDLNLDFDADTANVNIRFEHLTDKLVTLNVTASGGVGIFAPADLLNVTFDETRTGSQLQVISTVRRASPWPWDIWLNVTCDLHIDPSMIANMIVTTKTGNIILNTDAGAVFNDLTLTTTTGGIQASLGPNVVIKGDIVARTTTGGVDFSWNNANATTNALVDIGTTTGAVNINVAQNNPLPANITMNAQATTGGITFTITIRNSVGAIVQSTNTVGGVTADPAGFTGTASNLQSSNYPADCNLNVTLRNTTGQIHINATYTP